MSWHRRRSFVLRLVWLYLVGVGGLLAQGATLQAAPKTSGSQAEALSRTGARRTAIVEAVERVRAAVVNIHSERTVPNSAPAEFFNLTPSQNRVNGMGTGIIIDPRGYIVTNQHVVDEVQVLRVRLANGATQHATVLLRSPETDLALLKIDAEQPLATMPLGTASDLLVGETVIAIGNAYGYEHTVSVGVVSAIKRDVSLNKDMSYKALIQTDASINPGNSGGPLLNVHGDLIGVNVAIRAGAQGIGFAIPVDNMIKVVSDMLRQKRRAIAFDGLTFRNRLEAGPDGPVRSVVVDRVEAASPASVAGLKPGDQLLRIDAVDVASTIDLERGLLDKKPGDSVALVSRRAGQQQRQELTLANPDRHVRAAGHDLVWQKLGMHLEPIPPGQVTKVNPQLQGGLAVTSVQPDGLAAKAGIKCGDILVGLHQWETISLDNVTFVLGHPNLANFNPLAFFVVRSGQVRRGYINY